MMKLAVQDFKQEQWAQILELMEAVNLIQTWEYAQAKGRQSSWMPERGIFLDGDQVIGAVQVMIRRVPGFKGGLVWVNRAPLWRQGVDPVQALPEMLALIRDYWVLKQGFYLRLALPVIDEFLRAYPGLIGREYHSTGCLGWSSARLDLSPLLDQIRKSLDQKWRNCLNKSEKSQLQVQLLTDIKDWGGFFSEYQKMLTERGLETPISVEFLSDMQSLLPHNRKMFLFEALRSGQKVGYALIVRYGNCAEYLAGVMTKEGRPLNVGHLLLWNAISVMKEAGVRWFDVGGMDPDRTPSGIFHFKNGIKGVPYRFVPELETSNGALINKIVRWRSQKSRMKSMLV